MALSLLCVVVIVLIVGALYRDTSRDVEVVPPSESQGVDTPEAAISGDINAGETPERSVAALVAGFGLITIWVGALSVSLTRAHRRQRAIAGASDGT